MSAERTPERSRSEIDAGLTPQEPEKVKPLTLTLTEKAQKGVLSGLMRSLQDSTSTEAEGYLNTKPEVIEQLDEVRRVTSTIARNLKKEIDPMSALYMGLTDFIPPGQLQQWSNMPVKDNLDIPVRQKARYFLAKETRKQQPPKPQQK